MRQADAATVYSAFLADKLAGQLTLQATEIPDCVELPQGTPRPPRGTGALHLLWFGHETNAPPLLASIEPLVQYSREVPCVLEVVSGTAPEMIKALDRAARFIPLRFTAWSTETLSMALQRCDLAIFPTGDSDYFQAKSANRIQETLWCGRLPVGQPRPGLNHLEQGVVTSTNLVDGLRWVRDNPKAAAARLAHGHDLVSRTFTPAKVTDLWEQVIRSVRDIRHV